MKKSLVVALPLGLALAGSAAAIAAPAQAASHAAGSTYVHGTTHQASFADRATCARYASWSYRLLA